MGNALAGALAIGAGILIFWKIRDGTIESWFPSSQGTTQSQTTKPPTTAGTKPPFGADVQYEGQTMTFPAAPFFTPGQGAANGFWQGFGVAP